ncbi:hypothetical protein LXA43DRAFT_1019936 [Ganoderma leucocontextum]|nr:hypothetical protein LXA43DRAFT_1019936 [Ganoderma leucocontextum]
MRVAGRTLSREGLNVGLGCFSPTCPRRLWRGRGRWAPHHRRIMSEVPTHQPFSVSPPFSRLCGASNLMATARPTAWLTHHHHHHAQASAAPSMVSPPGGCRRSRRVALRLSPSPRITSLCRREVDEPTPFWYSRLSGTGDSDCAGWARRTARLSLRLCAPGSSRLAVDIYK